MAPPPPPPQTPTPHRFLAPRRSQQPTGGETPRSLPPLQQQQQQQSQGQHQQFQATPRFSLRSTLRGPDAPVGHVSSSSATTPAAATAPRTFLRTARRNADRFADDVIDSSPPPPPRSYVGDAGSGAESAPDDGDGDIVTGIWSADEGAAGGHDSIAIHSSLPLPWDQRTEEHTILEEPAVEQEKDAEFDSGLVARAFKRRRVGSIISSEMVGTSEEEEEYESHYGGPVELGAEDADMEDMADCENSSPRSSHGSDQDGLSSPDHQHQSKDARPTMTATPAQPTFHRAPRFKQTDRASDAAAHCDPLPDVFSPQGRRGRRGNASKYTPGGLAAELRDWLVEIETGGGSSGVKKSTAVGQRGGDDDEEWVAKVIVMEARESPGMVLVHGHYNALGANEMASSEAVPDTRITSASDIKVVLAGAGRLTGFARRNEVVPGAVVGIATPTWDIELLDLGVWTVACDWIVLR